MPNILINALRELKVPYIDLILHPVRFLPDLVVSFRTNVLRFHNYLENYRLSDLEIEEQAGFVRAKSAWMKKPCDLPPGSVMVIGQVATDRAMVQRDGSIATLQDHVGRLHRLCCEHPRVFYKPHPYDYSNGIGVEKLGYIFPTMTITTQNFYHMVVQSEIEGVVALNSSCLVEAKLLGKWSENLIPNLYDYENKLLPRDGMPGNPIPLVGCWHTSDFWNGLFNDEIASSPIKDRSNWKNDCIRKALNADWGYDLFNRIIA